MGRGSDRSIPQPAHDESAPRRVRAMVTTALVLGDPPVGEGGDTAGQGGRSPGIFFHRRRHYESHEGDDDKLESQQRTGTADESAV